MLKSSDQDSVVSGATLVDGTQLAPQQLGLMGMEELETVIRYRIMTSFNLIGASFQRSDWVITYNFPHCSYWEDALGAYNPTANNLMLTTAEEAEFIKNIEDILEAAYNLQDASEMLFIHQNSVLNKRELALQAKKELLYDREEPSLASGSKESQKHRRVISISSLEEVSFVSAQDTGRPRGL